MKIYDGTDWKQAKSLKINDGAVWKPAKKAWILDGPYGSGAWRLFYPYYPINSSGLSFIYSGTTYPTIGTTWEVNSTWNSEDAYLPTSYTYKWYRSGQEISGATAKTYTTTSMDIDKIISAQVTAVNLRGSTPITGSTGVTILPFLTSLVAYDATPTPSASISLNVNGLSYSGSWSSTNATSVSITSNNGQAYPDSSGSSGNYSGIGSAGPITISGSLTNSNKRVYLSWPSAQGAASYEIIKYGNNVETKITVSSSTTNYTWENIADGNETNYFSVYPKSPAGISGYGKQQLVSTSNKFGSATAASSLYEPYPTAPSNVYGSDNSASDSGTFYWNASTSPIGRSITGYSYTIYKSGSFYTSGSTTATNVSVNDTGSFSISVTGSDGIWNSSAGTGSGTFTVKAPGTPSPSPYSVSHNQFSVSWSAIAGASSYSVKVGTFSGGSNIIDTTISGSSTTISGLSEDTIYYVSIAAYKNGYGYGGAGTTSQRTSVNPTVTISTPTTPTFYRSGSTMKWGFDNPSWTGPFTPFGIEWEVRATGSSGGTLITGGNTKNYNTTWISSSGLASIWHYIVGTHAGDLTATTSARYLRFRIYGQNDVTYAIVNGPWSGFA